jgi:hypothetical protein
LIDRSIVAISISTGRCARWAVSSIWPRGDARRSGLGLVSEAVAAAISHSKSLAPLEFFLVVSDL